MPSGTELIAKIQVAKILEDEDVNAVYRQVPKGDDDPQTLDELLALATEEIGIDLGQFSEAVLFGDNLLIEPNIGVIVRGTFEEDALIWAIEKLSGPTLDATEYKGERIYLATDEEVALNFLESDTLVLGTLSAVKSVIDVQEGAEERTKGRVFDAFDDLGDVLIRLALVVPPEATQQLDEGSPFGGGLPIDLSIFSDIDLVAVAVDKQKETLRVELRADFTEETSAVDAGDALTGLFLLLKGLAPDDEIKGLLGKVQVSTDRERVTVVLEITISELGELAGSLEDGIPGFPFGPEVKEARPIRPPPTVQEMLEVAPDLRISLYQGERKLGATELKLSDLRGKPVILNFWAGLCPPCRVEMPMLQEFYDEYGDRVTLLGLDVGPFIGMGSSQDGKDLLEELDITYPAGSILDGAGVTRSYLRAMPSTIFITAEGGIFRRWEGPLTVETLVGITEAMLAHPRAVEVTSVPAPVPATPAPVKVPATPAPVKVPVATPAPVKVPATPAPVKVPATPAPVKVPVATPAPVAVPATPAPVAVPATPRPVAVPTPIPTPTRRMASEIEMVVHEPEVNGFDVSINGVVTVEGTTITSINWQWGDGSANDSWFPAEHTYDAPGSYQVVVTAFDGLYRFNIIEVMVVVEPP